MKDHLNIGADTYEIQYVEQIYDSLNAKWVNSTLPWRIVWTNKYGTRVAVRLFETEALAQAELTTIRLTGGIL